MAISALPRRSSSCSTGIRVSKRNSRFFGFGKPKKNPCASSHEQHTSSTFSQPSSSLELSAPLRASLKSSGKRRKQNSSVLEVRFDTKATTFHSSTIIINEAEIKQLWYTEDDYKLFRANCNFAARTIAQADERLVADKTTYTSILQNVYAACMEANVDSSESSLTSQEEDELLGLYIGDDTGCYPANANTACGLEGKAIPSIAQDKSQRRKHLVQVVRALQEHLSGHNEHDAIVALQIRRHSETLSLPSRLFAQHLAQAQREAIMAHRHRQTALQGPSRRSSF